MKNILLIIYLFQTIVSYAQKYPSEFNIGLANKHTYVSNYRDLYSKGLINYQQFDAILPLKKNVSLSISASFLSAAQTQRHPFPSFPLGEDLSKIMSISYLDASVQWRLPFLKRNSLQLYTGIGIRSMKIFDSPSSSAYSYIITATGEEFDRVFSTLRKDWETGIAGFEVGNYQSIKLNAYLALQYTFYINKSFGIGYIIRVRSTPSFFLDDLSIGPVLSIKRSADDKKATNHIFYETGIAKFSGNKKMGRIQSITTKSAIGNNYLTLQLNKLNNTHIPADPSDNYLNEYRQYQATQVVVGGEFSLLKKDKHQLNGGIGISYQWEANSVPKGIYYNEVVLEDVIDFRDTNDWHFEYDIEKNKGFGLLPTMSYQYSINEYWTTSLLGKYSWINKGQTYWSLGVGLGFKL